VLFTKIFHFFPWPFCRDLAAPDLLLHVLQGPALQNTFRDLSDGVLCLIL